MCLAIPGQIVEFHAAGTDLATVDVSGVRRRVNIGLLEGQEVAVGDWVLIHVGFAMNKIGEAQAREQMRMLALLGEDEVALEEFNGILDRSGISTEDRETPMKYVDEFRDPHLITKAADEIRRLAEPGRHYRLMEVCGGHTHAIYRFGLKDLLPPNIELVHGPGCPVCVLPMGRIDDGLAMAEDPRVILTAFGDMMRVPGTRGSLLEYKARGCDVRIVYSPLDALRLAQTNPDRHVVFFAIGFETTAPSTALTLRRAKALGVRQLQRLLESRDDHSGDPRDPRFARHADRRVHRSRARLDGHRLPALRVDRQARGQAHRRDRIRAARPAAVDRHAAAAAPRGTGGGREPVQPRRAVGGQPRGARGDGRRVRVAPRTSSGAAWDSSRSRRCG